MAVSTVRVKQEPDELVITHSQASTVGASQVMLPPTVDTIDLTVSNDDDEEAPLILRSLSAKTIRL